MMMHNSRIVKFTKVFTFQNILLPPKDILSPLAITLHSVLPAPDNRDPLCLRIGLLCTFPVSGVTPCVSSCVCLSLSVVFSGSVHVVVSVRASLLFMAEGCFRVWRDHVFLHHVLVELCFHRLALGLPTPSLTQQCELTACTELRRCFSPPSPLSQPGVSVGSHIYGCCFCCSLSAAFKRQNWSPAAWAAQC